MPQECIKTTKRFIFFPSFYLCVRHWLSVRNFLHWDTRESSRCVEPEVEMLPLRNKDVFLLSVWSSPSGSFFLSSSASQLRISFSRGFWCLWRPASGCGCVLRSWQDLSRKCSINQRRLEEVTEGEIKCNERRLDKRRQCCKCWSLNSFGFYWESTGSTWPVSRTFGLQLTLPSIEDVWNMTNTSPGVDLALICRLSLLTMFTFVWQIRLRWTLHPEFLRAYARTLEFTVKNSCVGSFASSGGLVCVWTFAPTPTLPKPAATLAGKIRPVSLLFFLTCFYFFFVLKLANSLR